MLPRRWMPLAGLTVLVAVGVDLSAATYVDGSSNASNVLSAHADWTAPTATSVVGKTAGGVTGTIKQGGTYYVYANATDTGNPATGVSTVSGNLNTVSSSAGSVALVAGSYTAGGSSWNYRSASLTARATLAAASYAYTLTLADVGTNSATLSGFTVTVDNTAPTAADVQTVNVAAGTAGKAELGDRVILTSSEPIDPNSIVAGWSGAATNVVVRITEGGVSSDTLTIRNTTNSAQLPLGSVNLARTDFVTATRDFGATGTAGLMVQSGNAITITLGTPSGTTGLAAAAAAMIWTPVATATDGAGNAAAVTARTETGTADLDF